MEAEAAAQTAQYFYIGYRVIHLVGLLLLFLALGGMTFLALLGKLKESSGARTLGFILHGIAMVLLLLGGFGLMARTGISHGAPWPAWIWVKLVVWVLFGASMGLFRRAPDKVRVLWPVLPVLGAVAVFTAIVKYGAH